MSFTITFKGSTQHYDFFHPYEGWEEDEDEDFKDLMQRCIEVCPRDSEQIIDLQQEIVGADVAESDFGAYAMLPDSATLEVNDEEIENPFSDYEKYEVPEPEDMFEQVTENKFCFVMVWENSEEWSFKGEGEFDLSKLTYEKGKFLYAGEEFDNDGGDGSSSFTAFYRDGIPT